MAVIDELTKVFEEVFDQSSLKLTPETTANDIEGWDSMSHVTMLMAVEEHFGIEFKPYEIANLVNVGALIALVEKKVTQK
ncbi:Acyl carrier protein [bioreactor metagenome]|uniref:Acyl carrier protein n=1 Tax=bioreactor metagenome TaxID=1076179 RepID=A0A644ZW11_9ZZZZ